jgi:hypothetical protein
MKINVTRDDIKSGRPGKPTQCMVALALRRELGISYASVGYKEAKILVAGHYTKLYLPKRVEKKIRFWDQFHFVLPFSFELVHFGFLTGATITRTAKPRLATALICDSPQTA